MALRKFYGDRIFNRAHKNAGQYWLKIDM
jgi:hypothetical protein